MSKLAKALTAAAGNAAGESLYVEDVFSTYLYTGNGSTQAITNGIDLDGEGGLVWIKARTVDPAFPTSYPHNLFSQDSGFGYYYSLESNSTSAQKARSSSLQTFNSDGFSIDLDYEINQNGLNYASWTFRKAEKFFDVVTYTGNGVAGRTVSHNLGSVPAVIIVKRLSGTTDWNVYHSSLGATKRIKLNTTDAEQTLSNVWNNTSPTDSVFTLGTSSNVNNNGDSYVAYLFASDAGGFGDDGSESIIKCGSYTGNGSYLSIDCGFEAQWVLIKRTDSTGSWIITDAMRGMTVKDVDGRYLYPNLTNSEATTIYAPNSEATGFSVGNSSGGGAFNTSSATYIYIAIRRPMKTPESGTEVFALQDPGYPVDSNGLAFTSGFPVDFALLKERTNSTDGWYTMSRMQGNGNYMKTNSTAAETSGVSYGTFDHNTGWYSTASASMSWMFKRATGFFDVVAYTGDGVAGRTVAHNLGAVPELMIVKRRSATQSWYVYNPNKRLQVLNSTVAEYDESLTASYFGDTSSVIEPTSTQFTVGSAAGVNAAPQTYIAYLFATLAGVSKVGSYTGTGSNVDVDCGFSAGARFVLIKRTDSTGDWYVYDYFRGIVSGNDPYLLLNTGTGEVTNTDYIDPLSSGFTVTSSAPAALNDSGGTYIFLAIA